MVQLKAFVLTDLSKVGSGKEEWSPVRSLLQVYTVEGDLIASHDSQGNYSIEDLVAFGNACRENKELPLEEVVKRWRA